MNPTSAVLLAVMPVILWRRYERIRRLVVRRKSKGWRQWLAAIFFPLLVLLLGSAVWRNYAGLAGLAGGIAAGVALAVWGLRLTRFESTPQGLYYTPNSYLGIALSFLLISRILYRLFEMYDTDGVVAPPAAQDFGGSPLTLLIFGMLAGYYATYAAGLLRRRRTLRQQPAPGSHE